MSGAHLIYIPMVAMVGMFLGFVVGARAARNSFDLERRRAEEREAIKAERARKKAERTEASAKSAKS